MLLSPTYSSRGWVGGPWHTYPLSHPRDKRRGSLRITFSSNCPALQDLVQVLPHFDLVAPRWPGMRNLAPLGLSLCPWRRQTQPQSENISSSLHPAGCWRAIRRTQRHCIMWQEWRDCGTDDGSHRDLLTRSCPIHVNRNVKTLAPLSKD